MIQEDKNLLLQDLCARLPYGIKVQYLTGVNDKTYVCNVDQVSIKSQCVGIAEIAHTVFTWRIIERIKPYLRPMSSMTEEEKKEYKHLVAFSGNPIGSADFIDWLNAHHFDYRGLIERGLAIEVTGENNPYKD